MTTRQITPEDVEEYLRRQSGASPPLPVAAEEPPSSAATSITSEDIADFERRRAILPSPVDVSEEEMRFGPKRPIRGRFSMPEPPSQGPPGELGRQRLEELRRGEPFRRPLGIDTRRLPPQVRGAASLVDLAGRGAEASAAFFSQPLRGPTPPFTETLGKQLQRDPFTRAVTESIADPSNLLFGAPAAGRAAVRGVQKFVPITRPLRTAAAAAAKEPWQMTRAEAGVGNTPEIHQVTSTLRRRYGPNPTEEQRAAFRKETQLRSKGLREHKAYVERSNQHLATVQQALAEGRPVPDEVLAEYLFLSRRISVTEPTPQVGSIQAGMGIGEEAAQGELGLGGKISATEPVPLIDAEEMARQAATRAQIRAGQQALPEAVVPSLYKEGELAAEAASPSVSTGVQQITETDVAAFLAREAEVAPPATAIPPAGPPSASPPVPPAGGVPPTVPPVTPPTGALPDPRVPPGQDIVIQKALRVIKGVKRVSKREQAALFATERRTRFARGMAASEGLPVEQGFKPFFAAQAGEFARPDIAPIVGEFTGDEISHLFRRIEAPGVLRPGYDRNNAAAAFADLLHPSTAKIPMPRDLALLERAFGADFARALYNKKRSASQAVWDEFIATWNLPRSLVASLDISATARQGAMLAPGNLGIWKSSVAAELKAYGSEAYAAKVWDNIYLHPNFERLVNAGLSLTERGAVAPLAAREEVFMSRWASRIPGVRASERAYVTMLNKLRFDVANKMMADLEAKGLTETDLAKQLEGVADFVNWTTGRGAALGGQGVQAVLNGLMFSPRFTTSRFQVLALPLTAYRNPAIRQKLASDLVKWVGVTAMVVGLAKAAGADVELDPRSGQWGLIRIGRTRYDPWAGMRPVARLIAGLYWGQSKSSLGQVYSTDDEELISKRQRLKSEGKMSDEEFAKSGRFLPARASVLIRFLRSKLQPFAGETWDQATGKDWLGGEATPGQALSKDPRVNLFAQNLTPILAQDIMDAVYAGEHPVAIGAAATASAVGVGASTYWTAADVARAESPGITEEQMKSASKATRKRWQEEANRRRGETVKERRGGKGLRGGSVGPRGVPEVVR